MDTIQTIETTVFICINHLPHTWWSDFLAQVFSGFGYAWIMWAIIGIVLFLRKEKKDHWFWVPLGVAALLCWLSSEIILKQLLVRSRPDLLPGAIIVGQIPHSYSFPSTHATVAFAFAYLFSRKEVHWMWLYSLAILVCFSRVYLGHHYLTDVLVGMILGTGIGILSVRIDGFLHTIKRKTPAYASKTKRKKL